MKNQDLEPLRQSVVVYKYNLVVATSVMALVPNSYSIAVPLDPSVTWTRGRNNYMGNTGSSIYHRPGI